MADDQPVQSGSLSDQWFSLELLRERGRECGTQSGGHHSFSIDVPVHRPLDIQDGLSVAKLIRVTRFSIHTYMKDRSLYFGAVKAPNRTPNATNSFDGHSCCGG